MHSFRLKGHCGIAGFRIAPCSKSKEESRADRSGATAFWNAALARPLHWQASSPGQVPNPKKLLQQVPEVMRSKQAHFAAHLDVALDHGAVHAPEPSHFHFTLQPRVLRPKLSFFISPVR